MHVAQYDGAPEFSHETGDRCRDVRATGRIAHELAQLLFPAVRRDETRSYRYPRHNHHLRGVRLQESIQLAFGRFWA